MWQIFWSCIWQTNNHFEVLSGPMRNILLVLQLFFASATFGQGSFNMDSLFNWQDPSLVASAAHANVYNEIWGYAKNGQEYAIIGSTAGTHIFDVTDPSLSAEVAFIEGALTGPAVVHRDFHDYDDYLYIVCDEGNSTLQIADLRFLPDSAPVVYDSNSLFPRSHNIFIDSSSARMYVCGGTKLFAVYSLADPANPTLLLDCPTDVAFWSSVGYVHDVFVRGDTAYLNAEQRGLFIVDFSNLSNVQMIGSIDVYPQQGYNHSGWLMENEPYYAFADETHGMDVKILDVSDMSDLEVTDTVSSNVHPFSIPHNLIYKDEFLFVSYYFDGLYMFDCSDPAHPVLAAFYDTSTEPQVNGFYRGCWGVYPFLPSGNILASDMQTGLWVFGSSLISGIDNKVERENNLAIYPNPTTERLFIAGIQRPTQYRIVNMLGNEVALGTTSSSIDVRSLQSGPYVLVLDGQEGPFNSRFLKQ